MPSDLVDITGGSDMDWGLFLGNVVADELAFRRDLKLAAAQTGNTLAAPGTNGQRTQAATTATAAPGGLPDWLIPAGLALLVAVLALRS